MPGKESSPTGSRAGGIYKALADLRDELLRQTDIKSRLFVNFKVATTAPLTVYLAGGATAVAARGLSGASYSINDTGKALVLEGESPILLKTV